MTILERLQLELSHKEYFTVEEYIQFLEENNLYETDDYDKELHQIDLLKTVIDILDAVSNDIDLMRKIETEFLTTGDAYEYIRDRIIKLTKKIADIQQAKDEEYSPFTLFWTRGQ